MLIVVMKVRGGLVVVSVSSLVIGVVRGGLVKVQVSDSGVGEVRGGLVGCGGAGTVVPRGPLEGKGSALTLSLGALTARPSSRPIPQISSNLSITARTKCLVHKSAGFSSPRTLYS